MSQIHRPRAVLYATVLAALIGGCSQTSAPDQAQGSSATPAAAKAAAVDIAYEEFTLPNGLRVIVHTDRKAPVVAVNLWYHVGSKDEPAGRTASRTCSNI